jgi:hypothetical protein
MQLFLRECLTQYESYHKSGDDWHRIKLVEELKNEGKEEVVCNNCKKLVVLGPAFKCSVCRYLIHLSCGRWDDPRDSTIYFHFGRTNDELMLTEELKNDGKEGVVCLVCEEQAEGPGYKCSASECNFRFHKSCAQLPRQMYHPSHSNHILILELPRGYSSHCNVCGKWCRRSLFYRCDECDFNIDITCATSTLITTAEDCQHAFVPFLKKIHFTCEACGRQGTDFASLCTICRLFIHSRCAGFSRTINIQRHNHALTLTYSLRRQVKDFNHVFCKLCGQKVKTEYAAFCCQKCDFVTHLYCAERYKFKGENTESLPEKSVDNMEKINPSEIQHFSHPHNLILSHDEVLNGKLCDGCMHFIISAPFYNCTRCNFFLHTTCAQLPKEKKHIIHRHRLTFLPHAPSNDGVFTCGACGHSCHGFVYRCDVCNYHLDAQCSSISETLKHKGHQHSLILAIISSKKCNACGHGYKDPKNPGLFVCTTCDFALCFECATLPLIVRHKYDEHPLALTYVAEDKSREYYCLICEQEMDPKYWFYYCTKCDFPAHRQCILGKYPYIKFGSTYEDNNHWHPITFVRKTESSPPCDACGKTFDGMALECTQCKFNVHSMNSECMQKISNEVLHP